MKKTTMLIAMILIASAGYSQNFVPRTGGHCFTMDIPDYMSKSYDLNDVASLQYQNKVKEAYVIAIVDEKDQLENLGMKFQNASEFLTFFLKNYPPDVSEKQVSEPVAFESNGTGFAQAELTWTDEDASFYMLVCCAETQGHFYKILCWTLAGYKDLLKDDFQKIARSLKE
ncbi:MAG: hypothetical protein KGZ82_09750 [Bacteroidales bacterium]|nr:hypothetical protein [Bacteroidales bacterium]